MLLCGASLNIIHCFSRLACPCGVLFLKEHRPPSAFAVFYHFQTSIQGPPDANTEESRVFVVTKTKRRRGAAKISVI